MPLLRVTLSVCTTWKTIFTLIMRLIRMKHFLDRSPAVCQHDWLISMCDVDLERLTPTRIHLPDRPIPAANGNISHWPRHSFGSISSAHFAMSYMKFLFSQMFVRSHPIHPSLSFAIPLFHTTLLHLSTAPVRQTLHLETLILRLRANGMITRQSFKQSTKYVVKEI